MLQPVGAGSSTSTCLCRPRGPAPPGSQAHGCASTSRQRSEKAQSRGVWRRQLTPSSQKEGPQGGNVGVIRREGGREAQGQRRPSPATSSRPSDLSFEPDQHPGVTRKDHVRA